MIDGKKPTNLTKKSVSWKRINPLHNTLKIMLSMFNASYYNVDIQHICHYTSGIPHFN